MAPSYLPRIPMRYAAPAAAASFAYLNAKWALFYDWKLISGLGGIMLKTKMSEMRDRVNLFYILEKHALASSTADKPFIIYSGRTWTFKETYEIALRYGTWFKQTYNVKPREIVAVDFMNCPNFIFIWMGLWSIGAVPAFINYNLTGTPLVHSVKVSTARLLVVDPEVRPKFTDEVLATLNAPDFRDGKGPMEVVVFTPEVEAQLLQTKPIRADDSDRSGVLGRDMSILIYTSGTTGLPKPAIVSWLKCIAGGSFIPKWMGWKKTDRAYTCMPLYHSTAALLAFTPCLISGSTLVLGHRFSARNFWKEVREGGATLVQYVGETMRYLLAVPPEIDPVTGEDLDKKNNVRMIFGNGLRPDIWNRVKERFGIETIAEFYAATEGTSGHWNLSRNDFTAGAVGRNGLIAQLILGRTLVVVDVDHVTEVPWRDPKTGFCRITPRGEPGELIYALDPENISNTFQGYYNNSKATEGKILRNVFAKGDAWYRTGDTVRWDPEGRWYFTDRIGDTYRWRSENVSTSEVAGILGSHPDVAEANVYGVQLPHHEGRAGCAAIVFKGNVLPEGVQPIGRVPEPSPAVLESLATYVQANLPKYAVPLFLRVTAHMQSTGNNKQQKHILRKEGVDPALVSKDDRLYWLRNGKYVPFGETDWITLNGGQVRL